MSDQEAAPQQLTPEQQQQQAMKIQQTINDIALAVYTRMASNLGQEFTSEKGDQLAEVALDAAICGANRILGFNCKRVEKKKAKPPQAFKPDEGDAS